MTVTVHIETVYASIAAISISGVTVNGPANLPENGIFLPGTLYPNPERLFSNVEPIIETFGVAGAESISLEYDLNYRYLHCVPLGNIGALYNVTSLITAVVNIMVAFMTNDTVNGAIDLRLVSVSEPGIVTDPAANSFVGCDFVVHVIEKAAP